MNGEREPDIRAAGAVLWTRGARSELLVAVVYRPRRHDWSLPKGKVDPGETVPAAALREVGEETGFSAELGRFLRRTHYCVAAELPEDGRGKYVDYFAAQAGPGHFTPNAEVSDLRWLPPEQARTKLTYQSDIEVLDSFLELPSELVTVLLVRHAKAGKRESWSGDDDLRPLSEAGTRQATALATLLRAFAPNRVLAAPRLRCVQTVRECAEELGTEVGHEPLLSEEGYAQDPELAVARLADIAAGGGTTVVCSQGAVIPHLVSALAERDGLTLPVTKNSVANGPAVASKKASLWVLSFTPGEARDRPRLVAADYFPSPLPVPPPDK